MSVLIEWNDSLSVGIQEIDEQHKVLVELLNQLYTAIHERHAREACHDILRQLVEYTRIHFAVEESLMRILGYPDYEPHKAKHEALIDQIHQFEQRVAAGEAVSFELLHFLRNWLTGHIVEGDMRYVDHFLSRGVQRSWQKKGWLEKLWSR
ncbi:bacteriohemerythrin [Chitinibacteraceae bacterium HSL-7]